ncbi:fumarylacetoacetate hydrolase family protein [Mesorhizobium sp. CO1-1-8]|uniref:fumarylacetoacetate hydrolase family protein n=1 Tax=Mesorhizobium sp. CO1-1-8 TaxID=2876631 RepID=UPI001CD16173|nr:fumarylacetoacetate hydrolase family protein [Mesorhizobium sp. CO1-1-8]MBZ9772314.1 fumarylacetoacetate hydrolase family protein [Mesorhizobium sp. CO1-1-8]
MKWVRYSTKTEHGFGVLVDGIVEIYGGDMFANPIKSQRTVDLRSVKIEVPCLPSKMIALWNNSHSVAAVQSLDTPTEPLFFIKPANSYAADGDEIVLPIPGVGRIIYEAELGIVIGKQCKDVSVEDAGSVIFGYTCVNDLTALALLQAEAGFTHWSRAKGLDGFGPFGPVIATGLDPAELTIRARVNGRERQVYTTSDLILAPASIVSLVSRGMTLYPGDVIACGTSVGVGPVPKTGTVEIEIDGIGILQTHLRSVDHAVSE